MTVRTDLDPMTKTSASASRKAKTGQFVGGAKVLGTTKDGVHILKPKGPATHFTGKELREAVASARSAKRVG
jgi:hypothetical protein